MSRELGTSATISATPVPEEWRRHQFSDGGTHSTRTNRSLRRRAPRAPRVVELRPEREPAGQPAGSFWPPQSRGGNSADLAAPARSALPTPANLPLLQSSTLALRRLDVSEAIAGYREILRDEPDNFWALAGIGEALARVGLPRDALAALYRASLLQPPSWEAFQILGMWTRYAERMKEQSFDRPTGVAPPKVVVKALELVFRRAAVPDAGALVAAPVRGALR